MNKLWTFILLAAFILIFTPSHANASSKLSGRVIDKATGEPLPGANIVIENTGLGAATDFEGEYIIFGIPAGNYTVRISYLGYKSVTVEINLPDNFTRELNAELELMTIQGEEMIITAQAEGQMQAINQQITSNSIKNIVSSAKIQELPESNAAEAVGRLPGISLQRDGGEGNKVVIRGLSPQYNKISVNGVSMAATGEQDRSVDLSMISPNILEGIEVSKTAMADQEADQLGGTVNFLLRGAPKKPMLNATVQGGYSGLRREARNYYYVLGGGMRFFDDKLGAFIQANLENTDRGSNSATTGYDAPVPTDPTIYSNGLNLQDIKRVNKRAGGILVLDYELGSTKIKFSNSLNNIDINVYQRQENFDIVGRNHSYQATYSDRSLLTMMNALNLEQSIGDIKLVGTVSYSKSKTDLPKQINFSAVENNAFPSNWDNRSYQIYPFDIVKKANNNLSNTFVNNLNGSNSKTLEEEITGKLSLEKGFSTDLAEIKIKIGGDYKHKFKKYDFEQSQIPLNWGDLALARLYLADKFNIPNFNMSSPVPYEPFIDVNYDAGDFKSGADYTISNVPDQNTILNVFEEIKNLTTVRGQPTSKTLWYEYTTSAQNDYHGSEDYYAAYLLPTITFGNKTITFIPGVRYEHTTTEYTANRGSNWGGKATDPLVYFSYTSKKSNEYLLPMLHVKYQVTDWFDIRASYTHTLARPNYNLIIPTWNTSGTSLSWNNVDLKPAQSKNLDFFLSFYTSNIGLLSVGVFQKQIKDFAFSYTTWLVDSSYLKPEYPTSVKPGGTVSGYVNSPDMAKLWGFEAEWQSNFWFLPGALKGLVVNVNYTYTDSELKYPKWAPIYIMEQKGPIKVPKLVGTEDQGYYDRLLDQPTHIINLTAGFDIADFSIRCSMQFKSDVFVSSNFYKELRQTTEPLTLWNMKIRQKLPFEGLQVYLNLNNFTRAVDQTSNNGTGWFTNRGFYGLTADLGISYLLN